MTTQGTCITMTRTQVTWITLLQHKALGSRDYNTKHSDHNEWNNRCLDHVNATQIARYPIILYEPSQ